MQNVRTSKPTEPNAVRLSLSSIAAGNAAIIRDEGIRRRELLVNIAVLAFATGLGGCGSAGVGALSRTGKSEPDQVVSPQDFGAKGDGVTDDAVALQAALNSGKRVRIDRRKTYAFGSRLIIPTGGGLVGGGLLLMLTGAGKFDKVDYSGTTQSAFGLWVDSVSNARIEARVQMQANAAIRTSSAIWVRSCSHVDLDVEVFGFKETRYGFGLVEWNSNVGGTVKLNAHDCYSNSDVPALMQITGLSVDNNRAIVGAPVNSTGLRFDVRAKDIYLGPLAIAKYSYQTDAVALGGSGYGGHVGRVVSENVYEPLDVFSDHNIVEVIAKNCYWGVKLIHGASHNIIHATVDRYHKYALVYGGSSSPVVFKPVAHNRCYITATGGGVIGALSGVAAVGTDGTTAIYKPEFNYTEVSAFGDGINMDYIVHEEAGWNNVFVFDGNGFAIAAAKIQPTAGTGKNASTIKHVKALVPGRYGKE